MKYKVTVEHGYHDMFFEFDDVCDALKFMHYVLDYGVIVKEKIGDEEKEIRFKVKLEIVEAPTSAD